MEGNLSPTLRLKVTNIKSQLESCYQHAHRRECHRKTENLPNWQSIHVYTWLTFNMECFFYFSKCNQIPPLIVLVFLCQKIVVFWILWQLSSGSTNSKVNKFNISTRNNTCIVSCWGIEFEKSNLGIYCWHDFAFSSTQNSTTNSVSLQEAIDVLLLVEILNLKIITQESIVGTILLWVVWSRWKLSQDSKYNVGNDLSMMLDNFAFGKKIFWYFFRCNTIRGGSDDN